MTKVFLLVSGLLAAIAFATPIDPLEHKESELTTGACNVVAFNNCSITQLIGIKCSKCVNQSSPIGSSRCTTSGADLGCVTVQSGYVCRKCGTCLDECGGNLIEFDQHDCEGVFTSDRHCGRWHQSAEEGSCGQNCG
jgi:hypothetical protein